MVVYSQSGPDDNADGTNDDRRGGGGGGGNARSVKGEALSIARPEILLSFTAARADMARALTLVEFLWVTALAIARFQLAVKSEPAAPAQDKMNDKVQLHVHRAKGGYFGQEQAPLGGERMVGTKPAHCVLPCLLALAP